MRREGPAQRELPGQLVRRVQLVPPERPVPKDLSDRKDCLVPAASAA